MLEKNINNHVTAELNVDKLKTMKTYFHMLDMKYLDDLYKEDKFFPWFTYVARIPSVKKINKKQREISLKMLITQTYEYLLNNRPKSMTNYPLFNEVISSIDQI